MTYEKFTDFVNDTDYFRQKLECHSKRLYVYDEKKAEEEVRDYIARYDPFEMDGQHSEDIKNRVENFLYDILADFSFSEGFGSKATEMLSEIGCDEGMIAECGKQETDILEVYLTAFKLAREQLSKALDEKIQATSLSERVKNALKRRDIVTVQDLTKCDEGFLLGIRNFGRTSLDEVKEFLQERNLSLSDTTKLKDYCICQTESRLHTKNNTYYKIRRYPLLTEEEKENCIAKDLSYGEALGFKIDEPNSNTATKTLLKIQIGKQMRERKLLKDRKQ